MKRLFVLITLVVLMAFPQSVDAAADRSTTYYNGKIELVTIDIGANDIQRLDPAGKPHRGRIRGGPAVTHPATTMRITSS
jgi:hypothetical protein